MSDDDFLVEIGTEELPPKALRSLMDAFTVNVTAALDDANLDHGPLRSYASPRRLAVIVDKLARRQPDRHVALKGPPVSVAFDDAGQPTPAATAFAKKCGVDVAELDRSRSSKGEWLVFERAERGQDAVALMPDLIERALASLPMPRRMRWGDSDAEFVRPVHWIIMLYGSEVVDGAVLGVAAGRHTRGHRFHSAGPLEITTPADYLAKLEADGRVIADFERRRALVKEGVEAEAERAGGHIVDGEALYDEVAALVEWPVPLTGRFDEGFLRLPREVIVSTLTGHQRYFPVAAADGALLPLFVTVANLESRDPGAVRDGNERVIRPRLADAAFFWDTDQRTPLAAREAQLREVVYQRGLGSLHDRSVRIASIAGFLAGALAMDPAPVERAAMLSKCDLLTGMVGEFPELQGTMGRYYAEADGESAEVSLAIGEQYLPRFAGDALPTTAPGRILALADKLDTITGVFAIGKKPTGNRDPFALRRAALGIVRILIECDFDLDLRALLTEALRVQPAQKTDVDELYDFVTERLRHYFLDADPDLATETFDAVMTRKPTSLVDFRARLYAVQAFLSLEGAESLAAANKRIRNILRQAGDPELPELNRKLLGEPAEAALCEALDGARNTVAPLLEKHDYTAVLTILAALRGPVDRFFDDVMVMIDDEAIRNNRLALLRALRALFLNVADISRLSVT